MKFRFLLAVLITAISAYCPSIIAQKKFTKQWNIRDAAGLPDWLKFSIDHRTRYETLDVPFRRGATGRDQILAFRTLVFAEVAYGSFRLGAEFIDSRIALDDAQTPINTTLVDETDLLQAYLTWQTENFLGTNWSVYAKGGRQTMDFGSRRLIARNRYRNTINAFTGLDFNLQDSGHWQWRSFFVLPVNRLPNDRQSIDRDVVEFDRESFDVFFTGTYFSVKNLPNRTLGEIYLYYLNENDNKFTGTKNRKIFTPGIRWYRKPAVSQFDFELETALQTGTSRATNSATNQQELNHFAYFGHASIGYTFDYPWEPRFILQYDYASGDENPNDGKTADLKPYTAHADSNLARPVFGALLLGPISTRRAIESN